MGRTIYYLATPAAPAGVAILNFTITQIQPSKGDYQKQPRYLMRDRRNGLFGV